MLLYENFLIFTYLKDYLDKKLHIDTKPTFEDYISDSISCHENDHFITHCRHELGLLITLLRQIRYLNLLGLWRVSDKSYNYDETFYFDNLSFLNIRYGSRMALTLCFFNKCPLILINCSVSD